MQNLSSQKNNPVSQGGFSANEEMLVMDELGKFKILKDGKFVDYVPLPSSEFTVVKESVTERHLMDTGQEEIRLQPPPPAIISKKASFYFHPEDEEEAAKHAVQITDQPQQKKYSLDKILLKIIENYGLKTDSNFKNKLRLIVFNFLRDRRTVVATSELLKEKSVQESGLTLEVADNLIEFLKEIKQKINEQGGLVIDEIASQEEQNQKYQPPKEPSPKPAKPFVSKEPKEQPSLRPIPKSKLVQPKKQVNQSFREIPKIQRPAKTGDKKISDVKEYKLTGPIDELAKLDLETFHRLSKSTAERAAKVVSRINFLAEESLAKKTAGLKAWRSSPLYKMYLAVGQASMEHGVNIEEIIKGYQAQGKEIITAEEFEAISDINKQLRF